MAMVVEHYDSQWSMRWLAFTDRPPQGRDRSAMEMPNLKGTEVSVIVPDDGDRSALVAALALIPDWIHEVILVTANPAIEMSDPPANIRVLIRSAVSLGSMLEAGCHAATGEVVVAVLPNEPAKPEALLSYVAAVIAGADLVYGKRFGRRARAGRRPGRLGRSDISGRSQPYFAARKTTVGNFFDERSQDLGMPELGTFLCVRSQRPGVNVVQLPGLRRYESKRLDIRLRELLSVGRRARRRSVVSLGLIESSPEPNDVAGALGSADLVCE